MERSDISLSKTHPDFNKNNKKNRGYIKRDGERSDISLSKLSISSDLKDGGRGKDVKFLILPLLLLLLAGCATAEYKPLPDVLPATPAAREGVYHKVAKGQTVWRIAKLYGVTVDEVTQSNHIPNVAAIEVNQLVFIPGAREVKDVPVRQPDENTNEFAWPLKGKLISYFNDRKGQGVNRGVDIEAAEGDTVKAARGGTVVLADYLAGYGHTLMVDHGDGFVSVYAQNRKLLSQVGEQVYRGDPIAEVGRTARKSFLHFELRKGPVAVNPLYYLPT